MSMSENGQVQIQVRAPLLAMRAAAAVAAIAAFALASRYSRLYYQDVVDDAMTSMQYAKQLALGHGLVFNVGDRVEGYTNFLWVVFMAPIYALCSLLHVQFVPVVVHVNAAIAAGIVALTYRIGAKLWGPGHLATWTAVALCVVDNSFTVWAALGLETHFLGLWMLAALALAMSGVRRRAVLTGVMLAAAHLTRPDAALFCIVLVATELSEAVWAWRRHQIVAARRSLIDGAVMGGTWIGIYAVYFAWRYWYYGFPFPNTYYLKLAGSIDAWARGLEYAKSFFEVRAWVPAFATLGLLGVRHKAVRALAAYVAIHTAYLIYVGGDFFSGHRFFVPLIPQFALLVGAGLAGLWDVSKRGLARRWLSRVGIGLPVVQGFSAAMVLLALAVIWKRGLALGPLKGEILEFRDTMRGNTSMSRWLGEQRRPGDSIATCLIGHTGFYSDMRVIDVCGVIDVATAHAEVAQFGHGKAGHEKIASLEYVLAQRPTYVGIYVLPGDLGPYGYYLSAEVPRNSAEGIWIRDTKAERGTFLDTTRIDFEADRPEGWTAAGTAFEEWPMRGPRQGQGELVGSSGRLINTFHPDLGNRATGSLRSAPFDLVGDALLLRVAGGRDPFRLRVSLLIDGAPVFEATGNEGDMLSRREWDIRPFRGRQAVLEIVDSSRNDWGYIAVDDIVQWKAN